MKNSNNDIIVDIDLKEIIIELWKKKWLIAIAAVICAMLAFGYTRMRNVSMYESKGSIMILNQKEEAGDSTQLSVSTRLTDDYVRVILSRNIVNQVIENLKLDATYEEISGGITTELKSDSRVITIQVINESPQIAKQIVDELQTLSIEYIKNHLEVHAAMILDEGNLPTDPIGNNNKKLIVLAFAAGMVLAAMAIVILYVMNDTINTEKDIEHYLNRPFLGEVSKKNFKAEEYEVIRTNLKIKNKNTKSIVVTKSLKKENIGDMAYQLAVSFGKGEGKVLYIDADLRQNSESKQVGLTNVLNGSVAWKEAVKKAEDNEVYVLNAGTKCETPSEILDSEAFQDLLTELEKEYACIIFSTPSMIDYIDAAIVASQCDGVVLAVEYGKTDFPYVKKAMKQLEYVGASVIGSVISKN